MSGEGVDKGLSLLSMVKKKHQWQKVEERRKEEDLFDFDSFVNTLPQWVCNQI